MDPMGNIDCQRTNSLFFNEEKMLMFKQQESIGMRQFQICLTNMDTLDRSRPKQGTMQGFQWLYRIIIEIPFDCCKKYANSLCLSTYFINHV